MLNQHEEDQVNNFNPRRVSDLSEMDYLAQTALSNNLMTGAVKSRMFPKVEAPSIENDEYGGSSNITAPSDVGLTKRTDNRKNLFHQMDDLDSIAMTPQKEDDGNSESGAWMKSMLTRADRTTESNFNQLSDRDNTRLSSNAQSSNPLSQLK